MSNNLRPLQWQIGDTIFGPWTQYVIMGTNIQSYNTAAQDSQIPLSDEVTMGLDSLQPQQLIFTIGVKDNAPMPYATGHLPAALVSKSQLLLDTLQAEWRANEIRQQWGQYIPLIHCDGYGVTKQIYGRPRKFQYSPKTNTSLYRKATAEFMRMDTYCHADTESAVELVNGADPVNYSTAGTANSWFRLLLTGPQSNPVVTVGSVTIQLNLNILAGVEVEVSGYPWARRIIDSNNLSLRTALVGATQYLDQLIMPARTSLPMSWAATETSSASQCFVLWRDAYNII